MSEDLKPCPFCGGAGQVAEIDMHGDGHVTFAPSCLETDCLGFQSWAKFGRRAEAKAAWNNRASPPGGECENGSSISPITSASKSAPSGSEPSAQGEK